MVKQMVVFGIFPDLLAAERGVDELKLEGFRHSDISVLFSSTSGTVKNVAAVNSTKVPEGTATGGVTGAAIGGVLGWLAGIGSIAIPGVGPFIAAGPIMAALAGASVGGAVGGVSGALIGFGLPEYEAKQVEGKIGKGGVLMSVHADDDVWATKAKEILRRTGAEEISKSSVGTEASHRIAV